MTYEMPHDAITEIDGLYYKIGRFGKPFYWIGGEWIRSGKAADEVKYSAARKATPYDLIRRGGEGRSGVLLWQKKQPGSAGRLLVSGRRLVNK